MSVIWVSFICLTYFKSKWQPSHDWLFPRVSISLPDAPPSNATLAHLASDFLVGDNFTKCTKGYPYIQTFEIWPNVSLDFSHGLLLSSLFISEFLNLDILSAFKLVCIRVCLFWEFPQRTKFFLYEFFKLFSLFLFFKYDSFWFFLSVYSSCVHLLMF